MAQKKTKIKTEIDRQVMDTHCNNILAYTDATKSQEGKENKERHVSDKIYLF